MFKERNTQLAESIFTELKSSYALLNARLGYGFLENKLSINIQILNLTDTKYQNILGAKMPGIWLMGGISWNFN